MKPMARLTDDITRHLAMHEYMRTLPNHDELSHADLRDIEERAVAAYRNDFRVRARVDSMTAGVVRIVDEYLSTGPGDSNG